MSHFALVRAVAITALSLCLVVVVLGAYVRLNNAGLGCPDWPGCYGHLTPAAAAADPHALTAAPAGRALDVGKAWREMVHRYAAGTLGLLIVWLTAMAIAWRRERLLPVGFAGALLAVVVAQGMLGMLTVTWQLTPVIVTLHLLFGFSTLSLLWWLVLSPARRDGAWATGSALRLSARGLATARRLAVLALIVLGVQIALGGWTSSNYAAIACPDLPTCQGSWWPAADFRSAYVLWSRLGINYEGGRLDSAARVAIHLAHRVGALAVSVALLAAALAALRVAGGWVRQAGSAVLVLLLLQLTIGVSMVRSGFPLWLATAHNAGAALLLLATLALNRSLRPAGAVALIPGSPAARL
jgi:cytochrome c oxidase assembly protein subunit 15